MGSVLRLPARPRRCLEVPALQAAAAGDGEDELVDATGHPHPPPEALQASGRAEEQADHVCTFPPGGPGHDAARGEPQPRPTSGKQPARAGSPWLPLRSLRRVQPSRRDARGPLHRSVDKTFVFVFIYNVWEWPLRKEKSKTDQKKKKKWSQNKIWRKIFREFREIGPNAFARASKSPRQLRTIKGWPFCKWHASSLPKTWGLHFSMHPYSDVTIAKMHLLTLKLVFFFSRAGSLLSKLGGRSVVQLRWQQCRGSSGGRRVHTRRLYPLLSKKKNNPAVVCEFFGHWLVRPCHFSLACLLSAWGSKRYFKMIDFCIQRSELYESSLSFELTWNGAYWCF